MIFLLFFFSSLKAFQKNRGRDSWNPAIRTGFSSGCLFGEVSRQIFLPTPKKILGVGNRGSCCAGARETEERARCEVGRGRWMPPLGVSCVGGSRLPVFRCARKEKKQALAAKQKTREAIRKTNTEH